MTRQEAAFEFQKALRPLVAEGFLTDQGAAVVLDLFITHLDNYSDSIANTLEDMIRKWEVNQFDDATLYSLGLRHALDVMDDMNPNRYRDLGTGVSPEELS